MYTKSVRDLMLWKYGACKSLLSSKCYIFPFILLKCYSRIRQGGLPASSQQAACRGAGSGREASRGFGSHACPARLRR